MCSPPPPHPFTLPRGLFHRVNCCTVVVWPCCYTPTSKNSRSHGSSNKEDEDLKCNCKICRRLRGLEQKLQETTDKNIKLVKQIRGLRQQSMKQRKENVKLLKGRDSLMTEKIKMRKEIDRLEQKFEKT